jgi:hypothetical protein
VFMLQYLLQVLLLVFNNSSVRTTAAAAAAAITANGCSYLIRVLLPKLQPLLCLLLQRLQLLLYTLLQHELSCKGLICLCGWVEAVEQQQKCCTMLRGVW